MIMNGIRKSVGALLCGASLLAAPAARADLAPPDVSCPTQGAACHNAAPSGVGDGVCTSGVTNTIYGKTSCGPADSAGAGGQTACLFCQAGGGGSSSGGSGGSSAAGASAGTNAAGTTASSDSSSSGCSIENLGAERGIAVLLLGLGAAALTFARRRK